jgi:hypothetical protein
MNVDELIERGDEGRKLRAVRRDGPEERVHRRFRRHASGSWHLTPSGAQKVGRFQLSLE